MGELQQSNLENCNDHDILRFEDEVCMIANLEAQLHDFLLNYSVNLVNHLEEQLKITTPVRDRSTNYEEWFDEGKECEILKQGQGWQAGKVKVELKIKFEPDESTNE